MYCPLPIFPSGEIWICTYLNHCQACAHNMQCVKTILYPPHSKELEVWHYFFTKHSYTHTN